MSNRINDINHMKDAWLNRQRLSWAGRSWMLRLAGMLGFLGLGLSLLAGCQHPSFPEPDDPRFAPVYTDIAPVAHATGGSLFAKSRGGMSLYQDKKAYQVGDILTVKLVEAMQSNKNASANLKKSAKGATKNPTLLGLMPHGRFLKDLPVLQSDKNRTLDMDFDRDSESKGSGDAKQGNFMSGYITVTIAQVLPNRHLAIRGEKWITLTRGAEYIRLTGLVRPEDIGSNNEVVSYRIADARITYSGKGNLADVVNPGWLAKCFNSPWFPL